MGKNPGAIDESEFNEFANSVLTHFGIMEGCDAAEGGDVDTNAETEPEDSGDSGDSSDKVGTMHGCLPAAESDKAFHYIDTDKNGSLSYSELGAGLNMLFKSKGIEPT